MGERITKRKIKGSANKVHTNPKQIGNTIKKMVSRGKVVERAKYRKGPVSRHNYR